MLILLRVLLDFHPVVLLEYGLPVVVPNHHPIAIVELAVESLHCLMSNLLILELHKSMSPHHVDL